MKTKNIIYTGIIAAIFLTAMIVYKDTLTLEGIILIFVGASGTITAIWKWINAKESLSNLRQENHALRAMHKTEFRKNQSNINTMADLEAEVILAQLNYINNNLSATHPAKQVAIETIENFVSVIGGGGILNSPPPK